jgi:hypothetical protein
MKTTIITTAGATICLCAALAAAPNQQSTTPAQTPPPQPQTQAPGTAQTQRVTPAPTAAMTLTGCLYRERDVPGRSPNIVEKAGVLEDYIVADARLTGQAAPAPGAAAGTSGRMYKVEGIPDERLKALVGKRVEITGRTDANDEEGPSGVARPDNNPVSRDTIDLSDFQGTSIKEVSGGTACAATPAPAPVAPR